MGIELITLEHFSLTYLTSVWNRCWKGYFYDMTYTPAQMKVWLHLGNVNLSYSIGILKDGQVIGFSLLGIDRDEGWIAGTSIDPNYRKQGFFKPLLKEQLDMASCLGIKRVYLEVLSQNPAQIIYRSLGFSYIRTINIYRLSQEVQLDTELRSNDIYTNCVFDEENNIDEYFKARRKAFFIPVWQRRESYLQRYPNLKVYLTKNKEAGALFSGSFNTPLLDLWSANADGAKEIINLVRKKKFIFLLNQPKDWITEILFSYEIRPTANQYEMFIDLKKTNKSSI